MYVCMQTATLPPAQPEQRLSLISLLFFWTQLKAHRHSHNAHTSIIYRQSAGSSEGNDSEKSVSGLTSSSGGSVMLHQLGVNVKKIQG